MNAVMITVGFFAVFFVTSKFIIERMGANTVSDATGFDSDDIGVVHADVPTG